MASGEKGSSSAKKSMALTWGYCQHDGPDKWGECFPEACGTRQSPVDIKPVDLKVLNNNKKLTWRYIPENTEYVTNTGYGWKVQVNGEGSALTGGPLKDKYILEQFHGHWGETDKNGSEHTIDGQEYAGELHLVHWNSSKYSSINEAINHPDGLCVLGVFLKPGKKHPEFEKMISQLPNIEYRNQTAKITTPLNPEGLLPKNSGFYTYQGSLTTPPCSQCVIWVVFKEPIEVSPEQLDEFRKLKCYCVEDSCPTNEFNGLVKSNYRPPLPLGQREIVEYLP